MLQVLPTALDGIEWDKIRTFARRTAALPLNSQCIAPLADYREIGKLAGECSLNYYKNIDPFNINNATLVQRAIAVGWLFYSMEYYNLLYEDLLENVGQTLASDIATISPDTRLPARRRWLLWQGEAVQAPEYVCWAVIAEIIARSDRLLTTNGSGKQSSFSALWVSDWVKSRQEFLDMLPRWSKQAGVIVATDRLSRLAAVCAADHSGLCGKV